MRSGYYDDGRNGSVSLGITDSESTGRSGIGDETENLSHQSSRSTSSTAITPSPAISATATTRNQTRSIDSQEHQQQQELTSISPCMLASALAGHSESGGDNDAWITTGYRYDYDCDMCHDDDDGANKRQLDNVNTFDWLRDLVLGHLNDDATHGWPADNIVNSLMLWCFWFTTTKGLLQSP